MTRFKNKYYWEYSRNCRRHWIDDGEIFTAPSKTFYRWTIYDATLYGQIHQRGFGYDLYKRNKKVMNKKSVKELKEYVKKKEEKIGNKIVYEHEYLFGKEE